MYIALKWLISLAVGMWLAMCFTDLFIKQSKRSFNEGNFNSPVNQFQNILQMKTQKLPMKNKLINKQQSTEAIHLLMFVAGALAISVFNKKEEIITFAKQKIKFDTEQFHQWRKKFKFAATLVGAAIVRHCKSLWEKMQNTYHVYKHFLNHTSSLKHNDVINDLIDKFKYTEEELKFQNQLLIAAINENKSIRMRFQLEVMAKNRLEQHIENIQKQIKEHRSRYVSFQQLYLVTHQENIFLKSRIRKLTQEKEDAERNLMRLMNEIYKSANNELKMYCNRTFINARTDKIGRDVSAAVEIFLEKSRNNCASSMDMNRRECSPQTSDKIQDDSLVRSKSVPRLKGLPGEYVWTVKDKNGIIEKLYEYENESDYDNGETIKRIRQYSVYFDKDCLLDFKRSLPESDFKPSTSGYSISNKYPVTSKRIVTGSQAFQNFLRNNKSLVPCQQ